MKPLDQYEVWFLTGSQDLYGEATLRQVAADAEQIARCARRCGRDPVRVVHKPVADLGGGDRGGVPGGERGTMRASASSPGCTRSRRPGCGSPGCSALQEPLLHLHTQFNRDLPWAEIDMDFMNLHQAAHGDREFGVHRDSPGRRPQDGRRALARSARPAADRRLGASGLRLARGAPPARRALRRQHAPRRRHRG